MRFATFNVRTSRADRGTSRHWLKRALSVAREIKSRNPGIVAIQELGPGRADGKKGKIKDALRQTESLEKALRASAPASTKLVRTTSYVAPGTSHGTQGARILYDTNKYRLVSKCRETTGKSNYNSSCSMDLPIMCGDGEVHDAAARRTPSSRIAAPARTSSSSRSTSTSGTAATSARRRRSTPCALRRPRAVYNKVKSLAGSKPILFGGDINSWRTKRGSHAPYNYLDEPGLP